MPTGAGSHWDIVGSANLTDGAATTNVAGLTDENTTFVAGQVKDTGNQTTGINLTVAEFTEIEFAVQPTLNATDDTTYCFRMTHAGSTTFFTYSVYGQARVGKPDVEQIHYRFRNDDGNEAAATWAAAEDTLLPYFPRLKVRRLRFEISNEGTSVANAFTYRLEVSGPNPALLCRGYLRGRTDGGGEPLADYGLGQSHRRRGDHQRRPGSHRREH